jgi:hypothetical protein
MKLVFIQSRALVGAAMLSCLSLALATPSQAATITVTPSSNIQALVNANPA